MTSQQAVALVGEQATEAQITQPVAAAPYGQVSLGEVAGSEGMPAENRDALYEGRTVHSGCGYDQSADVADSAKRDARVAQVKKGSERAAHQGAQRRFCYRFAKRTFDVVFSGVVFLLALLPGMLLCIAIRLDSPGSPFFRQRRVGKDGREIRILKFRSMYIDAHVHPEKYLDDKQLIQWKREQKVDADPRITRIGRFLRSTSIDEVPQFMNVLLGDMSVVGPRPVTEEETHEFGERRDLVLSVRPGITGLWQVTERNNATWENGMRQKLELAYVERCGMLMDLRIILRTFGTMFGRNRTGR